MVREYIEQLKKENDQKLQELEKQMKGLILEQSYYREALESFSQTIDSRGSIFSPRIANAESQRKLDKARADVERVNSQIDWTRELMETHLKNQEEYKKLLEELDTTESPQKIAENHSREDKSSDESFQQDSYDNVLNNQNTAESPVNENGAKIPADSDVLMKACTANSSEITTSYAESVAKEDSTSTEILSESAEIFTEKKAEENTEEKIRKITKEEAENGIKVRSEEKSGEKIAEKLEEKTEDNTGKSAKEEAENKLIENLEEKPEKKAEEGIKEEFENEKKGNLKEKSDEKAEESVKRESENKVKENQKEESEKIAVENAEEDVEEKIAEKSEEKPKENPEEAFPQEQNIDKESALNPEQINKFLRELYQKTEFCLAYMNSNRNRCKKELIAMKNQIKELADEIENSKKD